MVASGLDVEARVLPISAPGSISGISKDPRVRKCVRMSKELEVFDVVPPTMDAVMASQLFSFYGRSRGGTC